jgi:hypothetical protein
MIVVSGGKPANTSDTAFQSAPEGLLISYQVAVVPHTTIDKATAVTAALIARDLVDSGWANTEETRTPTNTAAGGTHEKAYRLKNGWLNGATTANANANPTAVPSKTHHHHIPG